ncbi:MAG TPA: hypothetical protein DET40_21625 [Lentisphaeria bacterium]|nr:hypothetical protein [Lentisphaeria bacterium]
MSYKIVPTIKKEDPITGDEIIKLMQDAGAVMHNHELLLAFNNLEDATAALAQLVSKSESHYWSIMECK